jgi:3-oxosteroid 1-dehydrogenase
MIEIAKSHGAALDFMDGAVWILTSTPPTGERYIHVLDLPKPHCILVNQKGQRYTNEAQSYMANGQAVYAGGDVPVWAIVESRHRERYPWAFLVGKTPQSFFDSGYMKKADTIEELAAQINVPADNLKATIERFNGFARKGVDEDFGRGSKAYDLVFADPTNHPNPGLGAIEKPPYFAVAIYPGDVGTFGGIMTDEFGRVVKEDGSVLQGLYATGNSTASVMGKTYPGAGASISPAFIFGWVAARHAIGQAPN